MPWKLFRQLGLYGGAYAGFTAKTDCSKMPLDPIECVGIIRLRELRGRLLRQKGTLGFCLQALEWLLSEEDDVSDWFVGDETTVEDERTAEKWRNHIDSLRVPLVRTVKIQKKDNMVKMAARYSVTLAQLSELNPELIEYVKNPSRTFKVVELKIPWEPILIKSSLKELSHIGKYFGVEKTEEVARAIWNGRSLGRKCKSPPPVFLPYLPEVLKKIGELSEQFPEGISLYTQDWRHFFHSIPVSGRLSRFFGVSIGGEFFRWRTLPMGTTMSCHAAQSVALALLLHQIEGEDLFDIPEGLEKLPTYIALRGGGFLCVYYDNCLVAGPSTVVERVTQLIRRNGECFEAAVKPGSDQLKTSHDLVASPMNFLGADLYFERSREDKFVFCWKQALDKVEKWRGDRLCHDPADEGPSPWNKKWTRRELASLIGRMLWRRSLYYHPRTGTAPIISLLRRLAKKDKTFGWDTRDFILTQDEQDLCLHTWTEVLLNPPHKFTDAPRPTTHVVLATDSSDQGYGYVMYDHTGRIIEEEGYLWKDMKTPKGSGHVDWVKRHIYLKELKCAIDTITKMAMRFPGSQFECGQDNSAAAAAIRNMFSGCVEACVWLDALHETLEKYGCSVNVWGLRSEENSSDPASRRCYPDGPQCASEKLGKACWDAIQGQMKGYHLGHYESTPGLAGTTCVRHPESLDEDDEDVDPGDLVEKIHTLSM